MIDGQEEPVTSTELVGFDKFKAQLAVFKAADAELIFDTSTSDGYAKCKAYHAKLRRVYKGVDDLRLATTATMRQEVKDTNTEGNAILAEIDVIANPRKTQFEAEDAKEAKVIADLAEKKRLETKKDENEQEAYVDNQAFDNAKLAKDLKDQQDAINKQRADIETEKQAEITKQETIKETKRQAAKEAKELAEEVEQEKKDTAEKAAKEKQDAIDKIESDRIAKELKEKNKQDELDEIERKRIADVEHRDKIEGEIIKALHHFIGSNSVVARNIVSAMQDGQIPHVTINY